MHDLLQTVLLTSGHARYLNARCGIIPSVLCHIRPL